MNGDLELLLKLQNVDYDLGELERSKEYVPDMIENLRREIDETESQMENVKKQLSDARLEEKDVELNLKEKEEKLKKLQERMMAIKTNKEYDALIREIDQIKMDIGNLETRAVELMEIIETGEKDIEIITDKAERIHKTNGRQLSSLQEQIDSVEVKIDEKEKERKELASQVGRRAIATYERIRRGKRGAAVVAVRKRACGACYKALPPQKIQEIKLGEQIITCDNCGRMLVWTENSEH